MRPTDPEGQYRYLDRRREAEAQVQAQAQAEFWDRLFLASAASKSLRKILFRTGLVLFVGPILAFVVLGVGVNFRWWGPLPPLREEAILRRPRNGSLRTVRPRPRRSRAPVPSMAG